MGRVRKYKKIKACDPFSKRHNASSTTSYDDPPELEVQRLKKKRRTLDWDNDCDRERLLQQQALRELKASSSVSNVTKPKLEIEPIRSGESLKRYGKRVREIATNLLSNQIPRMSATAKRRKEKLKILKQKKKGLHIPPKDLNEEEISFGSRSDGFIRHSDRIDNVDHFQKNDFVQFGETAQTPPDLSSWKDKLKTKVKFKHHVPIKNSVEIEKLRLQAIEAYKQIKERRKKQDIV